MGWENRAKCQEHHSSKLTLLRGACSHPTFVLLLPFLYEEHRYHLHVCFECIFEVQTEKQKPLASHFLKSVRQKQVSFSSLLVQTILLIIYPSVSQQRQSRHLHDHYVFRSSAVPWISLHLLSPACSLLSKVCISHYAASITFSFMV